MCTLAPHVAVLVPNAILAPRTGPPSGTPDGGRRVAAGCRAGYFPPEHAPCVGSVSSRACRRRLDPQAGQARGGRGILRFW